MRAIKMAKYVTILVVLAIVMVSLAGCIEKTTKEKESEESTQETETIVYQNKEFLEWLQTSITTLAQYSNYTSTALGSLDFDSAKFWADELMDFANDNMTDCMCFYLSKQYVTLQNKYYQALDHAYWGGFYIKEAINDYEDYDLDSFEEHCDKAVHHLHQCKIYLDYCTQMLYSIKK